MTSFDRALFGPNPVEIDDTPLDDERQAALDDAEHWIREAAARTSRLTQRQALRFALDAINDAR